MKDTSVGIVWIGMAIIGLAIFLIATEYLYKQSKWAKAKEQCLLHYQTSVWSQPSKIVFCQVDGKWLPVKEDS